MKTFQSIASHTTPEEHLKRWMKEVVNLTMAPPVDQFDQLTKPSTPSIKGSNKVLPGATNVDETIDKTLT